MIISLTNLFLDFINHLIPRRCHPVLHWLLLHLLPILHPAHSSRGAVERGLEGGRGTPPYSQGGGECAKDGGVDLLAGYIHHQGAGGEALADIIERLAGVTAGILGEDLVDDQAVRLAGGLVLKVLGRLDLLLVVKPEHIKLVSSSCKITNKSRFRKDKKGILKLAGRIRVCDFWRS